MDEHKFYAKVISGHRITIRSDIYDNLRLKEGMNIQVVIKTPTRQLVSQGMDVMI